MSDPAKSSIVVSRWHRPKLYLTAAAIILVASLAAAIFLFADSNYHLYRFLAHEHQSISPEALMSLLPIWSWVCITSATSITGSVWLLKGKKRGIYVSLAALVSMFFMLPFLVSLHFNVLLSNEKWVEYLWIEYLISYYFAVSVVVAAFALLIIGWKQIKWN